MALAKEIAPHLPYLRRFARGLAGSQRSGDAYVASTLEALIAEPSIFPRNMGSRVGLYRIFLSLWASVPINAVREAETSPGQGKVNLLTPRSRQAFLLNAVEQFSIEEVAAILDTGLTDTEALLAAATREIAAQLETDVLIIEDEPMIAMDVEALTLDLGHRVIGIARTHAEAVKLAKTKRPGLVLADIHLADGSSGFEAVNEILAGFDVPVIFITAFPERLLTGKGREPAFLITKPYQIDTVKAAISQALFFQSSNSRDAA